MICPDTAMLQDIVMDEMRWPDTSPQGSFSACGLARVSSLATIARWGRLPRVSTNTVTLVLQVQVIYTIPDTDQTTTPLYASLIRSFSTLTTPEI